jgi:hypothetical protein
MFVDNTPCGICNEQICRHKNEALVICSISTVVAAIGGALSGLVAYDELISSSNSDLITFGGAALGGAVGAAAFGTVTMLAMSILVAAD